jgi:hypothetical protein
MPTKFMIVSVVIAILFSATVLTNTSYAQLIQPLPPQSKAQLQSPIKKSPTSSSTQPTQKVHPVRITSPTPGQHVPVGKNLTITGTSLANATSSCQITVGLNRVRPYQSATAAGKGGASDYSKWNFVLTPKYASLIPGPNNKITARYSCSNDPALISYYSVNVTGGTVPFAPPALTTATLKQGQGQSLGSNSSSSGVPGSTGIVGVP